MTIEHVAVPGATLHVETTGAGPLLVLVVGGNGDSAIYAGLAAALAPRFTVMTWDRRGFVRSPLDAPVPDDKLAADVVDAVALLERANAGPALVFGSSSGAIVALELLTRRPDLVDTVVAHEPPLVRLLPDGDRWIARFEDFYQRFRTDGPVSAIVEFAAAMGMTGLGERPAQGVALPPAAAEIMARAQANMSFWFEYELRQYPRDEPDIDALRAAGDRLVLAGGHDSRANLPYRPNVVLSDRLGRPIVDFPGDHVGYAQQTAAFAKTLQGVLDHSVTSGR